MTESLGFHEWAFSSHAWTDDDGDVTVGSFLTGGAASILAIVSSPFAIAGCSNDATLDEGYGDAGVGEGDDTVGDDAEEEGIPEDPDTQTPDTADDSAPQGCKFAPSGSEFSIQGSEQYVGDAYVWGRSGQSAYFCNEDGCTNHNLATVSEFSSASVTGLSRWTHGSSDQFVGTDSGYMIINTDYGLDSDTRISETDAFSAEFCTDSGYTGTGPSSNTEEMSIINFASGVRIGNRRVTLGECAGSLCLSRDWDSVVGITIPNGTYNPQIMADAFDGSARLMTQVGYSDDVAVIVNNNAVRFINTETLDAVQIDTGSLSGNRLVSIDESRVAVASSDGTEMIIVSRNGIDASIVPSTDDFDSFDVSQNGMIYMISGNQLIMTDPDSVEEDVCEIEGLPSSFGYISEIGLMGSTLIAISEDGDQAIILTEQ